MTPSCPCLRERSCSGRVPWERLVGSSWTNCQSGEGPGPRHPAAQTGTRCRKVSVAEMTPVEGLEAWDLLSYFFRSRANWVPPKLAREEPSPHRLFFWVMLSVGLHISVPTTSFFLILWVSRYTGGEQAVQDFPWQGREGKSLCPVGSSVRRCTTRCCGIRAVERTPGAFEVGVGDEGSHQQGRLIPIAALGSEAHGPRGAVSGRLSPDGGSHGLLLQVLKRRALFAL